MNNTVNFLIESGISLSVLTLIYVIFLRKETFFRLNRFFLLGSLLFSVLLPFLNIRIYEPNSFMLSEITITPHSNIMEAITIYGLDFSTSIEQFILSDNFIIWIYFTGLLFFLGRFLFSIIHLTILINKNEVKRFKSFNLVILKKECCPFSFLNYIFINSSPEDSEGYKRVIEHETEHVRQGHSIDVLILELFTAFQWFNPFMWLLRRAIRENHEFQADNAVINSGVNRGYYKKLLLNQFLGSQVIITNNFNYSLIKNRIKMMSKIKSAKISYIKAILGLLTALALIIVFACDQKASAQIMNNMETTKNTEMSVDKTIFPKNISNNKTFVKTETENNTDKTVKSLSNVSTKTTDKSGKVVSNNKNAELTTKTTTNDNNNVFFIVEDMPEFPGGEKALRNFIATNVKYPVKAQENGIQGKVYISFVVNKTGKVTDAKVVRGVDPSLDKEALRVVNNLPKWKPGKQRGKKVNVNYTLPISFALQ